MGKFHTTLPPSLLPWILSQPVFFVSTAPLSPQGHVNVSPKGTFPNINSFGYIPAHESEPTKPAQFWYLDLSGSGSETIAHLYEPENGRITVMFCEFGKAAPRIVRLFGRGKVLEKGTKEFQEWTKKEGVEVVPGARSVVVVEVELVGDSCGFAVPVMEFRERREVLNDYWRKKVERFEKGLSKGSVERLVWLLIWVVEEDADSSRHTDTGRTRTLGAWTDYRAWKWRGRRARRRGLHRLRRWLGRWRGTCRILKGIGTAH